MNFRATAKILTASLAFVTLNAYANSPSVNPPGEIKMLCTAKDGSGMTLNVDLKPNAFDANFNMTGSIDMEGIPLAPGLQPGGADDPNGSVAVKARYFDGQDTLHPQVIGTGVEIRQVSDDCAANHTLNCNILVDYFKVNLAGFGANQIWISNIDYSCQ